jgi:hypothetical protein
MRRALLAVLVLSLLAPVVFGDTTIEAAASVDRNKVKLGDVINYTITVKRQGDISRSPEVVPPPFDGFRLTGSYSQNSVSIINNAASMTSAMQYDLVAIKSGEITIKPAKISVFNAATGKNDQIETKPVVVHVGTGRNMPSAVQQTPTPEPTPTVEEDIKEIKMNVAFRFSDLIPYIILAVLFIIIFIIAWRMIFKKKELAPAAEEEIDFRREAQKKLKKAQERLKSGEIKLFYYEIYETVRYFLESRMQVSLSELTTQEITGRLEELKLGEAKRADVSSFMSDCDIVKFADYTPNEKEIEAAYARAEEIIEKV